MSNEGKFRIAVSGKSGCGNSTVSRLVSQALGLKFINYTFRDIAREKGIDFRVFHDMAQADSKWDYYLDDRQKELAADEDCILGSRLAIWLLEDADLRIFLSASPEVRSKRIMEREGGDYAAVLAHTIERDRKDHERFYKLYGIDNDDFGFVDLVADAEARNQFEIRDLIVERARQKGWRGGPGAE